MKTTRLLVTIPFVLSFALGVGCSDDAGSTTDSAEDEGADAGAGGSDEATDDEATDDEATDDEATDDEATDDEATDDEATDDEATDDEATDEATDDEATDEATDEAAGDAGADDGATTDGDEPGADGGAAGGDDEAVGDAGGGSDPVATDDEAGDAGGSSETPAAEGGGSTPTDPGKGTFKSGTVFLVQARIAVLDTEIISWSAGASFNRVDGVAAAGEAGTTACETQTVGACVLSTCDTEQSAEPEPGQMATVTAVSAGLVEVDGLAEPISLDPGATTQYPTPSGMGRLWSGGEELTVSAAGSADVPAFEISMSAPSSITLSEPVIDLLTPTSISRSEALQISWSDGEVGSVSVAIGEAAGDNVSRSILCQVNAAEGGVSVSEDLLAQLGAADDTGSISIAITGTETLEVEDWVIAVGTSQSAAAGTVTFTD